MNGNSERAQSTDTAADKVLSDHWAGSQTQVSTIYNLSQRNLIAAFSLSMLSHHFPLWSNQCLENYNCFNKIVIKELKCRMFLGGVIFRYIGVLIFRPLLFFSFSISLLCPFSSLLAQREGHHHQSSYLFVMIVIMQYQCQLASYLAWHLASAFVFDIFHGRVRPLSDEAAKLRWEGWPAASERGLMSPRHRCNSARCKFSTEKPVISQDLYPVIFIRRLKIWNIQFRGAKL